MNHRANFFGTVSILAVLLNAASPVMAQSLLLNDPTESARQNDRSAQFSTAYDAVLSMNRAHTMMRRLVQISELRHDYATPYYDGTYQYTRIEDHLVRNKGDILTYVHSDGSRPYNERFHAGNRFDIKYRICGIGPVNETTHLPEPGFQYVLMTVMGNLPAANQDIRDIFAMGGVTHTRLMGLSIERAAQGDRRALIGVLDRGRATSTFHSLTGDVLDASNQIDVPDCLLDERNWNTRVRTGRSLAIVETINPMELRYRHTVEEFGTGETELCMNYQPAIDVNKTIGIAQFVRGRYTVAVGQNEAPEFENYRLRGASPFVNPDNGTPSDPSDDGWVSDRIYDGGCRGPLEREGLVDQTCEKVIAGQPAGFMNTYRVKTREVPPARGYYEDGEEPVFVPIDPPEDWIPVLEMCGPQTPRMNQNAVATPQVEDPLQCSGNYPNGTWARQRDAVDTTYTMPRSDINYTLRSYTDWETTRNDCSRTDTSVSRQTQTINGCLDQYRDVTTTTVSYADGRAPGPNDVTANDPVWVNTANRCNTGGSSGGNDRTYIDIDRDGIGDIPESGLADWAREKGYTVVGNNNLVKDGITTYTGTSTSCNFKCDGSSATSGGSSNLPSSTPTTGGGLSGFLSNAWNSIKNAFSGGSSSSGGNSGGGGGGGSDSCFVAGTLVAMADGSFKAIERIKPDDIVLDGGAVLATMQFLPGLIYDLYGVHVSGSHLVARDGKWIAVEDHPDAMFLGLSNGPIYNLATENNTMICGGVLFADHLEVAPDLVEEALAITRVAAMAELSVRPTVKSKLSALKAKVMS